MKYILLVIGIVMLTITPSFGTTSAVIARKGAAKMIIVVGANPIPAEITAAKELADYLHRITGASFTTVVESNTAIKTPAIYVGWTSYSSKQGIVSKELGEESWLLRTVGNNLILTGGRPRGTLYAVYGLLERQLGCHWFDEASELVPHIPTLALPNVNITGKPDFSERSIYTGVRDLTRIPDWISREDWFHARNKSNGQCTYLGTEFGSCLQYGSPGSVHTFESYMSPKDYFKEHPEYFSKNINGDRESGLGQLCLTNKDVQRIVFERLKGFIVQDRELAKKEHRPYPTLYDISPNDFHHLCQCADCQAIAKREDSQMGPLLQFINAIAANIAKDYPDIRIHTLAYTVWQKPPKTMKARDNVVIRFCDLGDTGWGEFLRPFSHPYNKIPRENLEKWCKIAKNVYYWDYWTQFSDQMDTPYSNAGVLQGDLAWMHKQGVKAIFAQLSGCETRSFFTLRRWLGFQLMQNSSQPVKPLINTFLKGYYGPGAVKMGEYLAYLEKRIADDPDRLANLTGYTQKYLDLQFFITSDKLLAESENACVNDPVSLRHVKRERIPIDGTLLRLWGNLERGLSAGSIMPFDRKVVLDRYEANRYALLDQFRSPVTIDAGKAAVATEMVTLRAGTIPLPEQFSSLSPDSVTDFNWTSMNAYGVGGDLGSNAMVDDPDAAGGKALYYEGPKPELHDKALDFGVYDETRKVFGPSVTIKAEDQPQDGKYHWYKIGRFPLGPGVRVHAHWSWMLGVALDRAYNPAELDHQRDFWISVKVTGPAYVRGSTDKNAVWMDRVILVKP